MKINKNLLPKEVSEKFELVNWKGGPVQLFGRFGKVDITKLTVKRAEALVANGFSKLKTKPTKKASKKTEEV